MNNELQTKVGIVTFHYAVNPGSALQAYGLYKTISSFGFDEVEIVNYQETKYRQQFMSFKPRFSLAGNIIQLYNICSYIRYQRFWRGVVSMKKRLDEIDLQKLKGYDIIVAGSDQIWNLELTSRNFNFFIPFCKEAKKISYAASIGTKDFPEEDKEIVAKYLNDFSYLSVREPEAQLAIERLIGRKPELVIDPSLLLNKSDYEQMSQKPKIKKDYVFLYLRHKDSEVVPFAKNYAKKHGLQIVECHGGVRKIYKDDKIVMQPNPREWLGWIMNAKYVFTDSFHGCAFCINCNKQFFAKISSANSVMSSRIYNILDRYGLNDRLIENENSMFSMTDIDFSESNALLEKDRELAKNYLKRSLGIIES